MILFGFIALSMVLGIYSYGFVDPNLHLTNVVWFNALQKPLSVFVFERMNSAGAVFTLIVGGLYIVFARLMRFSNTDLKRMLTIRRRILFGCIVVILVFSYPAFTHDLFNYLTTARVMYVHRENPYLVMPVEIPNESALAFTRAANKFALYGPTWLLLTWIPHELGQGSVWRTIIAFKLLITVFYATMLYLIYRITKSMKQVFFFGLNPLVLIEVLLSGHNDIVMMVFALLALIATNNWVSIVSWLASVGVKGATIVLAPLVFAPPMEKQRLYRTAYWLMFGVFVIFAPIREELYPWYAVWLLTFAAVIPITKRSFIHGFTIALCIGLSMRHLPYILTREYGGWGPMLRMFLTGIPVTIYTIWFILPKIKRS